MSANLPLRPNSVNGPGVNTFELAFVVRSVRDAPCTDLASV